MTGKEWKRNAGQCRNTKERYINNRFQALMDDQDIVTVLGQFKKVIKMTSTEVVHRTKTIRERKTMDEDGYIVLSEGKNYNKGELPENYVLYYTCRLFFCSDTKKRGHDEMLRTQNYKPHKPRNKNNSKCTVLIKKTEQRVR